MTGLWNLTDIQNSRQNRSKNKLVRGKTPSYEYLAGFLKTLSPTVPVTSNSFFFGHKLSPKCP